MDPKLEEAARDLGATAWGAFRYVTLPLILPAVAPGRCSPSRCRSTTSSSPSFNVGAVGSTTLPIYIYSSIKFGVTPADQRDLDDHRRGRLDRAVHRLAARGVPDRGAVDGDRGRVGDLIDRSVRSERRRAVPHVQRARRVHQTRSADSRARVDRGFDRRCTNRPDRLHVHVRIAPEGRGRRPTRPRPRRPPPARQQLVAGRRLGRLGAGSRPGGRVLV